MIMFDSQLGFPANENFREKMRQFFIVLFCENCFCIFLERTKCEKMETPFTTVPSIPFSDQKRGKNGRFSFVLQVFNSDYSYVFSWSISVISIPMCFPGLYQYSYMFSWIISVFLYVFLDYIINQYSYVSASKGGGVKGRILHPPLFSRHPSLFRVMVLEFWRILPAFIIDFIKFHPSGSITDFCVQFTFTHLNKIKYIYFCAFGRCVTQQV